MLCINGKQNLFKVFMTCSKTNLKDILFSSYQDPFRTNSRKCLDSWVDMLSGSSCFKFDASSILQNNSAIHVKEELIGYFLFSTSTMSQHLLLVKTSGNVGMKYRARL